MAEPERATEPWGARLGPPAIVAAAIAVPLIYLPGLDSVFVEPKLALLMLAGALGLGGYALALAYGTRRTRWPGALAAALGALLLTTEGSSIAAILRATPGAPYASGELLRWLAVLGVALGAAQAAGDPDWRWRLFQAIHAAAGVVSLIGILQHLQVMPLVLTIPSISVPGSTFGNRNMAAEAVAMALPFGLGLALRAGARPAPTGAASPAPPRAPAPVMVILFLALETVYLAVTRTRGAWLGGLLGVMTFFALQRPRLRRPARVGLAALAAAAVIAAIVPGRFTTHDSLDTKRYLPGPRVVMEAIDPTASAMRTRLGLWRRTLAMVRAQPLLGVGPGNFAVLFPLYAEPGATADGVLSATVVPRRAHNDLLERLAETGVVGLAALLAVYLAAAAIALRRARGLDRDRRDDQPSSPDDPSAGGVATSSAAASLAALLAAGLTGFPLAMPATALLFGIAAGVLAAGGGMPAVAPRRWSRPRLAPAAAGAFALAAVLGAAVVSARGLLASHWLGRAEVALRERRPGGGGPPAMETPSGAAAASAREKARAMAALNLLALAERADPSNFRAALLTAHAAVKAGQGAEALRAAERALALEPYSPHAWAARADASLQAGDVVAAAESARRATTLLADYPAALSIAARAAARLGDRAAEDDARARLAALAPHDGEAHRLLEALGPAGVTAPATENPPATEQ